MSRIKLTNNIIAAFTRASGAENQDGSTAANNAPRFYSVDGATGIIIEEGTTNIIVAPTVPVAQEVAVTQGGDYTLSFTGNGASSGNVDIVHKIFEDTQADFNTGTLSGVTALASGAIALDMQADPTFTRATVATKKDFSQVSSGAARFENIVDDITIDSSTDFSAGTLSNVVVQNASDPSYLYATFTSTSTGANYRYVDLTSVTDYTVVSGDWLEYEIYWEQANTNIAVDLSNSAGTAFLRDTTNTDQNGLLPHADTDLSAYALSQWYKRRIQLPGNLFGVVIAKYNIAAEQNAAGTYSARIRNIKITDSTGNTLKKNIWSSGDATPTNDVALSGPGYTSHSIIVVSGAVVGNAITIPDNTPSFARVSVAYKADGTYVTSGTPRYEQGKNLLQYNNSCFESNSTGDWLNGNSGVPTVDSESYEGKYSLRVTGANTSARAQMTAWNSAGVSSVGFPTIPTGAIITLSGYAKFPAGTGSGNASIAISVAGVSSTTTTVACNDSTWTRFSVTRTLSDFGSGVQIQLYAGQVGVSNKVTLWDNIQVEFGSVATTWTPGGRSAIRIEEATTNLLSVNQSNVETDTAGFANTGGNMSAGSTLTRVTSEKWGGSASLSVACTAQYNGVRMSYTALASTTYTFSAWVKYPQGKTFTLIVRDHANFGTYTSSVFTGNGVWQRVSLPFTTGVTAGSLDLQIRAEDASASYTFYVDGLQLEQKEYATSWQIGGTARDNDTLTFTSPTFVNPSQGTIIVRAYFDNYALQNSPPADNYLFRTVTSGTSNQLYLVRDNKFRLTDSAGNITSIDGVKTVTTAGWNTIGVRWSSTEASVWINGVKAGFAPTPYLPSTIGTFQIGAYNNTAGKWNNLIDSVDFFQESLSDSEMATYTAK